MFNGLSEKGHSAPLFFASGLSSTLTRLRPDLVHVLGEAGYSVSYQVARWIRRSSPRPALVIRGAQNIYRTYPFPFRWFESVVLSATNCVIANGLEHEAVVRRKGYRGRVERLPLGVDLSVFSPSRADTLRAQLGLNGFVFGYVGKMIPAKGVHDLLVAFEAVATPSDQLLLVGDGPLVELIRRHEKSRPQQIVHVPSVPHYQVPEYMKCLDAFVLASRDSARSPLVRGVPIPWKEQFGRVLVEAMATGVPVIGSSSGEIPHVVDGIGLVFESGNRDALVSAMRRMRDNAELRNRCRAAGLWAVRERFSWGVISQRVIELYQDLVAARPGT